MTTKRFNELLNGPLHHPLPAFSFTRVALALAYVLDVCGESADKALEDYCKLRGKKDEGPL